MAKHIWSRDELRAEISKVKRPIQDFPRDKAGLFIQPDELTPKLAIQIEHNRDRMAAKWEYADEFTGNAKTFDIAGNYVCGTCNQANASECLAVQNDDGDEPLIIDRKSGSCGKYEIICSGDPELRAFRLPKAIANYGVAENGEGFGCHRCPFAKKTKWRDSRGRPLWCGYGGSTVMENACCTLNGAETVEDGDEY